MVVKSKGDPLISGKPRLVKYNNLARYIYIYIICIYPGSQRPFERVACFFFEMVVLGTDILEMMVGHVGYMYIPT